MKVVRTKAELRAAVAAAREAGASVGLVPTMGALHDGHLALLAAARERCDFVVMSLFVNPAQFRPGEDLDAYPRDEDRDLALAEGAGVDLVYAPGARRGLPGRVRDHGRGRRRAHRRPRRRSRPAAAPSTSDGVTTVVAKLFNAVGPDLAFFGQKDAQQAGRDQADGPRPRLRGRDRRRPDRARARRARDELAQRLPRRGRPPAARPRSAGRCAPPRPRSPAASGRWTRCSPRPAPSSTTAGIEPEYLEARDAETLAPVESFNGRAMVIAVAARVGPARLIDNVVIED